MHESSYEAKCQRDLTGSQSFISILSVLARFLDEIKFDYTFPEQLVKRRTKCVNMRENYHCNNSKLN